MPLEIWTLGNEYLLTLNGTGGLQATFIETGAIQVPHFCKGPQDHLSKEDIFKGTESSKDLGVVWYRLGGDFSKETYQGGT